MPPKCHLVQSVAWASGQCGGGRVPLGPPSKPALRGEEQEASAPAVGSQLGSRASHLQTLFCALGSGEGW